MPHDDPVFSIDSFNTQNEPITTNYNFIENLDNIVHKDTASADNLLIGLLKDHVLTNAAGAKNSFNNFLISSFGQFNESNPINTLSNLAQKFADYMNSLGGAGTPTTASAKQDIISTEVLVVLGGLDSATDTTINDDWKALFPTLNLAGFKLIAGNSFVEFLKDLTYPATGNLTADSFIEQFENFYTKTSTVVETPITTLNQYKQVYLGFGFDSADFDAKIAAFAAEKFNLDPTNMFFIPSHHFDEWFEELTEEFALAKGLEGDVLLNAIDLSNPSSIISTISGEARVQAKRTLSIDRVLRLLIEIIDTLHVISAVQATRLGFLADMQEAYTKLMEEIKPFAPGTQVNVAGSWIRGGVTTLTPISDGLTFDTGSTATDARASANAMNAQFIETIRSRRDIVGDEAKKMQSAVSQSQDAASQQTSIATAILQQISGLLSAIFR